MYIKDKYTGFESIKNKEGIAWALFITMIVAVGFVSVTIISQSSIVEYPVATLTKTASTKNITAQDVDITIIPASLLKSN